MEYIPQSTDGSQQVNMSSAQIPMFFQFLDPPGFKMFFVLNVVGCVGHGSSRVSSSPSVWGSRFRTQLKPPRRNLEQVLHSQLLVSSRNQPLSF